MLREEFTGKKKNKVLFVLSHSAYYVQDAVLNLAKVGDGIVLIQHCFSNRLTFADVPTLAESTSIIESNNVTVRMALTGDG